MLVVLLVLLAFSNCAGDLLTTIEIRISRVFTQLSHLFTAVRECSRVFAKYSQSIREVFAKYSQVFASIRAMFANCSPSIRKYSQVFAQYSNLHSYSQLFTAVREYSQVFAKYSRSIREVFAKYSRVFASIRERSLVFALGIVKYSQSIRTIRKHSHPFAHVNTREIRISIVVSS